MCVVIIIMIGTEKKRADSGRTTVSVCVCVIGVGAGENVYYNTNRMNSCLIATRRRTTILNNNIHES